MGVTLCKYWGKILTITKAILNHCSFVYIPFNQLLFYCLNDPSIKVSYITTIGKAGILIHFFIFIFYLSNLSTRAVFSPRIPPLSYWGVGRCVPHRTFPASLLLVRWLSANTNNIEIKWSYSVQGGSNGYM